MKVVCAWCEKDMGKKDGKGIEGTSHGICQGCLEKLAGTDKDQLLKQGVIRY